MQLLKLPAWKVGDRGFDPHSDMQVAKKQNVSSPLTRKYSIFRENLRDRELACSASDRQGSNSNPVSGGQCHLIHLTILRRFFQPSLANICAQRWPTTQFISFLTMHVKHMLRETFNYLQQNSFSCETSSFVTLHFAHATLPV